MKYGVNLLLYGGNFEKSSLKLLKRVGDMGFDGVELAVFDPSTTPIKDTKKALEDNGLGVTICTVFGDDNNIISESKKARQAGVDHLARVTDLLAELGGEIICGPIHSPVGCKPPEGRVPPARTRKEWNYCVSNLRKAAKYAGKSGVSLHIEPLNRFETYFLNTVEDTVQMCKDVGEKNVFVHYDTFHSNIEQKDVAGAIRVAGKYLGHVHTCEMDRGIPGTGHVPWKDVMKELKRLKYDGWMMIESFVPAVPEIAAATCIWRPFAKSGDELASKGLKFLKRLVKNA